MKGFVIPKWDEVKEVCLSASVNFPGLRIQNWDVALCDRGPVLVELNTEADLEIPQFIGRIPFLNDQLISMIGK